MQAVIENKDYTLRFPVDESDLSYKETDEFGNTVCIQYNELFDGKREYNKLYSIGKGRFIKLIKARELWNTLCTVLGIQQSQGLCLNLKCTITHQMEFMKTLEWWGQIHVAKFLWVPLIVVD